MRVVITVVLDILINEQFTYFWYTYGFNRSEIVGFGGIGGVGPKSNDIEFFQFAVGVSKCVDHNFSFSFSSFVI